MNRQFVKDYAAIFMSVIIAAGLFLAHRSMLVPEYMNFENEHVALLFCIRMAVEISVYIGLILCMLYNLEVPLNSDAAINKRMYLIIAGSSLFVVFSIISALNIGSTMSGEPFKTTVDACNLFNHWARIILVVFTLGYLIVKFIQKAGPVALRWIQKPIVIGILFFILCMVLIGHRYQRDPKIVLTGDRGYNDGNYPKKGTTTIQKPDSVLVTVDDTTWNYEKNAPNKITRLVPR